jgi:hypothetical protein
MEADQANDRVIQRFRNELVWNQCPSPGDLRKGSVATTSEYRHKILIINVFLERSIGECQ